MPQILLFFFIGYAISKILKKRKENKAQDINVNAKISLSDIPDLPIEFGYKVCWLAVKTNDINKIISNEKLENIRRANWETGIRVAY